MAEVLSDEVKKQRLIQLDEWGYDHNQEFKNNKLTEFLLLHWEDTKNLRATMDDFGRGSVFTHVLPSIGNYITEKNWPIIIKRLIEMSIPDPDENNETEAYYWLYEEKFRYLYRLLDERTVTYVLELVKIRKFYEYAGCIPTLPEEAITDIKNCLGPELIKMLKSMPYLPDAIFLIPFMKNLLKLFLQNNINMVYSIDKSGRILGYLFFSVLSNLGLAKKAKFYFMNVMRTNKEVAVLYSEKQKKELIGKNVLLIDDYLDAGTTIIVAQELLASLTGKNGKVVPAIFSVTTKFLAKMEIDISVGKWRGLAYHAVVYTLPSWYGKKEFAGVKGTEHGLVEVDEGSRAMATAVRAAFSKYAKLIAEYLRENMEI